MSDETLYLTALERLSLINDGDDKFEKICHIIVAYSYQNYNFHIPEGGLGTRDGGYDGIDQPKNAKLACSLEKDYKNKINEEMKKSKKNNDKEVFFFSNQIIPEPEKNKIKSNFPMPYLYIYGIDDISKMIDIYFNERLDGNLYDLLGLSFLKNGECFRRNEAIKETCEYNGHLYPKKLVYESNIYLNSKAIIQIQSSNNPLFDYIKIGLQEQKWENFKNKFIKGIGSIGKSFVMKLSYNALIDEFSVKKNYEKYKCLPFVLFFELKNYAVGHVDSIIHNNRDPVLLFLDGLDEINENGKINLAKEIQRIVDKNKYVRFIIAGRSPSFITEINNSLFNTEHLRLEKYIDPEDSDLLNILLKYKNMPVVDLLPIPAYRNFISANNDIKITTVAKLMDDLIVNKLNEDRKRSDYADSISERIKSNIDIRKIVENLSRFCFYLFRKNINIFSLTELQERFHMDDEFLFVLHSAILDYKDEQNISFVSNSYYEYFIARAFVKKTKNEIKSFIFVKNKINIKIIDIFTILLNILKTADTNKYKFFMKKSIAHSLEFFLLCDFDSFSDKDRYSHYVSIFRKYNKEKKHIYYGRFRQSYGVLINIDNMAQKMQMLLPESKRSHAIVLLKKEIDHYLRKSTKDRVIEFANSIILLTPFIENLWSNEQQKTLQKLSVPLLRFFILEGVPKKLNGLLSHKFIFSWYKDYKWTENWKTEDWESFFEQIYGGVTKINIEISDESEYIIKLECFIHFYDNPILRSLLIPLLQYLFKNKYNDGLGMASVVPEVLNDDYELPMIHFNNDSFAMTQILSNINLDINEILLALCYAIKNKLYENIKNSIDNPIKILEDKLYENITQIGENDYALFAYYYFGADQYGINDKLFKIEQSNKIDAIKIFLVNQVINNKTEIKEISIINILPRLINLCDYVIAFELLQNIKSKLSEDCYAAIISSIFNNKNHILHDDVFITSEYNQIFEKYIFSQKSMEVHLAKFNDTVKDAKSKEIELMLDNDAMSDELKRIDKYLAETVEIDGDSILLHKLRSLHHNEILTRIKYNFNNKYIDTPIFVQCAINILENFYRSEVININKIINKLQNYCFKSKYFYSYFYWQYIYKQDWKDDIHAHNVKLINENDALKKKIIESINIDVRRNFEDTKYGFFDGRHSRWITPFLYYYDVLLSNINLSWFNKNIILKLIAFTNHVIGNIRFTTDISLDWFIKKFPSITSTEIIEYALQIIPNIDDGMARFQITKYFIEQYNSNNQTKQKTSIFNFILETTQKMFDLQYDNERNFEYSLISNFWLSCQENHIEKLFSKFTIEIILSSQRTKSSNSHINFQYRKDVLNYCIRVSTNQQKYQMINDIKSNNIDKVASEDKKNIIDQFLASIGDEQAIKYLISLYLNNKGLIYIFTQNSFGFISSNNSLLNEYIKLFIYSTEKNNERRNSLLYLARNGIKQHLTQKNYLLFEKRIKDKIKYLKKHNQSVEYYEEYLLQMEQYLFS
jgi:hypothetical protein